LAEPVAPARDAKIKPGPLQLMPVAGALVFIRSLAVIWPEEMLLAKEISVRFARGAKLMLKNKHLALRRC
jgi:hypothetical protein